MKTLDAPVLLPRLLDRVQGWLQPVPTKEQRSQFSQLVPAQGEMIWLRRGQVTSLGVEYLGKMLRVTHGAIWLTDTPASGDHVLKVNDVWALRAGDPWVVQALEETTLVVEGM